MSKIESPSAELFLPRSKFAAPVAGAHLVSRARIIDRLFSATRAKVILLRAPAGFGKTTLMLELKARYERDGANTSWLHLDDADNDVGRLLTCLRRALGAALDEGSVGGSAPGDSVVDQAMQLIDAVSIARVPFVLFIDEFESLKSPAAIGLVAQILDQLPGGAQVVIGTRSLPQIGLGRLRARGHLADVDPAELRLTQEETADFLMQQRGLDLRPAQVQRLHLKTEGWVAALSLAAISLDRQRDREAFIAGFAGSNRAIADYLAEDVLAGQPEELRAFMLDTSILDSLCGDLCDALRERADSVAMLAELERANLFLVPLDEARAEYRYHSLFASFLRAHLTSRFPERLPALHRRAAQWFLDQNRPIPAIRHALATGDGAYAADLLAKHANDLLHQGRLRPLCHSLDALPPEQLDRLPQLRVVHAWASLFTKGPHQAVGPIRAIEQAATERPEFQPHSMALEPLRLGMMDRVRESYERVAASQGSLQPEHGFPYQMAEQAAALTSTMFGLHDEARRHADNARRSLTGSQPGFSAQISEYVEGVIDLFHGRLKHTGARIKAAAGGAVQAFETTFNRNAMPGLLLADILYETNELAAAERLLGVYVSLVKSLGIADQLIVAHTLLARIYVAQGDEERALLLLAEMESEGHRLALPRVVASAHLERARLALSKDQTERAKAELDRVTDADAWTQLEQLWLVANDVDTLSIGKLRLQVRSGGATRAVDRLKLALEDAEKAGRHRRALKLRILYAEALHRTGQTKPALRTLGRAIDFGLEEGFVRTFLDEGPYVESMIHEALTALGTGDPGTKQAALGAFGDALKRSRPGETPPPPMPSLADPLTSKEIRVLELLAEGLGNNAIGDRMFVSESTVRAHLRSINTKLQASNRVQALVIARRLGVVR